MAKEVRRFLYRESALYKNIRNALFAKIPHKKIETIMSKINVQSLKNISQFKSNGINQNLGKSLLLFLR